MNNSYEHIGEDRVAVGIIVPSPAFGVGLKTLLEYHEPSFRVDCICRDLASFNEKAPDELDIILLDAAIFGFSLNPNPRSAFVHHPGVPLVGVTVEQLLPDAAGAFDGLVHVYDEGEYIAHQMKAVYDAHNASPCDDDLAVVTGREKEIIIGIAKGLSNKEIASDLCLSPHTVATYRKRISAKLGIRGAAAFATYAMVNNFLEQVM